MRPSFSVISPTSTGTPKTVSLPATDPASTSATIAAPGTTIPNVKRQSSRKYRDGHGSAQQHEQHTIFQPEPSAESPATLLHAKHV